jgi:catechol 2,3-dioxygenase-like lactoylglutathione lyase family enzyme
MSTNEIRSNDMKFEIVVIPVSDIDRAKEFYARLGWRLDADYDNGADFRVIQFTPPGSGCSVIFGRNVTAAAPGSAQGLYLIVSDIDAARNELLAHGVDASPVFHDWAAPRQRSGSRPSQLPLIPLLQRPRWQRLAHAGDHNTLARACRRQHDIHVGGRPVEGAATSRSCARATRGADRASRPKLGGLVCRVHGARAGRRRTAEITSAT